MENNNYQCSIAAPLTPQQAFDAVANVGGWWTNSFKGSARKEGDTFRVDFGDTWVTFGITQASEPQSVTWHVTGCHLPWLDNKTEWTGTDVVWKITPEDGSTRIHMTHVGLTPQSECWDNCRTGWNEHIADSLHKLVTEGVGEPHLVKQTA